MVSAYDKFQVINNALPVEKQRQIIDSVFGPKQPAQPEKTNLEKARDTWTMSYQDMLNSQRKRIEQQRTDDVKMAKYNALGNLLTSIVQPIGWAAGGSTTGVIPYDNRQYLESFNRAVKDNDELRNIGLAEDEFKFKLADENYRRELALADEERKRKNALEDLQIKNDMELEKQKGIYDMRSQLNQEQIAGRIAVAEATAKAKYQFYTGNKRVNESVRDNLLKRANAAYAQILADYEKKRQIGIENLQEPVSFDEFLKKFASSEGIQMTESGNSGSTQKPASGSSASASTGTASKTPPSKQKPASTAAGASTANNNSNSKTPPSKR